MSIPERPVAYLRVGDDMISTWPEDAAIDLFHTGPTVGAVCFSDQGRWLDRLRGRVEASAADRRALEPIAGGAFRVDSMLDDPVLDLVNARAFKLLTSMLNANARLEQAVALVVPSDRELPLRPSASGRASVVMLVAGEGLELRHESIRMAPVSPPSGFGPGGLIAHPTSMRPCVLNNPGPDPVLLLTWDYSPE